jgi:twitching motility protein PilU
VQAKDGASRKAAVEVMINTLSVSELIVRGDITGIKKALDKSRSLG